MIIDPSDPTLKGGQVLQQIPVISWGEFVGLRIQVYKDGKIQTCIFDPQPMVDAEDTFQTLRLVMAIQQWSIQSLMAIAKKTRLQQKPGPVNWDTVPGSVKRHFRFQQEEV